jgi:hypothetical protein
VSKDATFPLVRKPTASSDRRLQVRRIQQAFSEPFGSDDNPDGLRWEVEVQQLIDGRRVGGWNWLVFDDLNHIIESRCYLGNQTQQQLRGPQSWKEQVAGKQST